MSYLVLARKFRPQTFASVVGQEHISLGLANAIIRDRVPHALLLTGPRGVGKTTSARVFARALNCTGRPEAAELQKLSPAEAFQKVEPCGECSNCLEIAKGSSLAVWEIDGASNNGVDNVRELTESLRTVAPPGSRYKIYIIDEVHMLSVAAFNALLKSLEEPPPNTIFIFATTEPHRLPETVTSRCQQYDFHRLPTAVIIDRLGEIVTAEKLTVEPAVLALIARKSRGGMRDAQSMLDRLIGFSTDQIDLKLAERILGFVDQTLPRRLGEAVLEGDQSAALQIARVAFESSVDLRSLFVDFTTWWRNLLYCRISLAGKRPVPAVELREQLEVSEEEFAELRRLSENREIFDLERLFELAAATADRALGSNYPRFVFEAGLVKMALLPELRPLAELVAALESGGGGGGKSPAPIAAKPARPIVESSAVTPSRSVSPTPAAVPAQEVKPAPSAVKESAVPAGPISWTGFVAHAKSQARPRLVAYLYRVTPSEFREGVLTIEGSSFDISSLQESDILSALRECLSNYSGVAIWKLEFKEVAHAPTPSATQARRGSAEPAFIPGSLRDLEQKESKARDQDIETEARNNSAVRAALTTFAGSSIDRVDVLKDER